MNTSAENERSTKPIKMNGVCSRGTSRQRSLGRRFASFDLGKSVGLALRKLELYMSWERIVTGKVKWDSVSYSNCAKQDGRQLAKQIESPLSETIKAKENRGESNNTLKGD